MTKTTIRNLGLALLGVLVTGLTTLCPNILLNPMGSWQSCFAASTEAGSHTWTE